MLLRISGKEKAIINAGSIQVPTCSRCSMEVPSDAEFCPHCGQKIGQHRDVPWYHIHRRVYDWTLAWAYRPSAAIALFILSFAESSFFPVPPDVLLMPLVLGNPRKWFSYALNCTLASVLGAMAGYLIGWLAWESPLYALTGFLGGLFILPIGLFAASKLKMAQPLGGILGGALGVGLGIALGAMFSSESVSQFFFRVVPGFTPEVFQSVQDWYGKYNFVIVFVAGFTPIPFKVITITAGIFFQYNPAAFAVFVLAAIVSRGARFFLVAGLMRIFGPKITPFIDKYFNLLALVFTALLIGGFAAIKYLA